MFPSLRQSWRTGTLKHFRFASHLSSIQIFFWMNCKSPPISCNLYFRHKILNTIRLPPWTVIWNLKCSPYSSVDITHQSFCQMLLVVWRPLQRGKAWLPPRFVTHWYLFKTRSAPPHLLGFPEAFPPIMYQFSMASPRSFAGSKWLWRWVCNFTHRSLWGIIPTLQVQLLLSHLAG